MSPRDDVVTTPSEDEVRTLLREPDTETATGQVTWEELPTDSEPMEEDPQEEDPSEYESTEESYEEAEGEMVEESEPEEDTESIGQDEMPSTPIASPRQPTPLRTHQGYVAGPSYTQAPLRDPYLPPPSAVQPPEYRWTWIQRVVDFWRREEGGRVPGTTQTSAMTPVCPVTDEPPHITIPLLVARLYRHENQIYDLADRSKAQPHSDLTLRLHHALRLLGNDHREVRDCLVAFEDTATRRILDLEGDVRRLRGLEYEVKNLRRMMMEMTLQNLGRGGPSSDGGNP